MYISRPMVLENAFCRHEYIDPKGPPTHNQMNTINSWCKVRGIPQEILMKISKVTQIRTYEDAARVIAFITPTKEAECVNKIVVV